MTWVRMAVLFYEVFLWSLMSLQLKRRNNERFLKIHPIRSAEEGVFVYRINYWAVTGFNEVVAGKNLILETLPLVWNDGNEEGFAQTKLVLVCIVFLCFALFVHCKSCVLAMWHKTAWSIYLYMFCHLKVSSRSSLVGNCHFKCLAPKSKSLLRN